MGGVAGRTQHLYDNLRLSFGDIKDVLTKAAEGKLQKVTEKLDGANLVFTYDNGLKVARNKSEISSGGLSAIGLAQKFKGRGDIEDAFNIGFKVLSMALEVIPEQVKESIFDAKGNNKWFSIELIYSGLSTTINYDQNHIVFHGSPVYKVDNGNIVSVADNEGIEILEKNIERMQKAITLRNWKIRGPAVINLKKLSDGTIANRAIDRINIAMQQAHVGDGDTIQDYLYSMALEESMLLGVSNDVAMEIAARISKVPGALNLTTIKKKVPKDQQKLVSDFVKSENKLKKKWIRPIELAVHDLSIEVLRGLHSSLIADSEAEVGRLRRNLTKVINAIQDSGHMEAMNILQTQMEKLKTVENISPMEGIVFIYKGHAYKFTGSFAPVHQIISLFTFGRPGVEFDKDIQLEL